MAKNSKGQFEFSTWSKGEKNAYQNALAGFAGALNPTRAAAFSPAIQSRIEQAKQAVEDVFSNGRARGIAQGATFYDNNEVTAQKGTGGFHDSLDRKYGSVQIGDHRFTGPDVRPNQPFDPLQLGMQPPDLPADLYGFDQQPASAGFSLPEKETIQDVSLDFPAFNPVDYGIAPFSAKGWGQSAGLSEFYGMPDTNLGLGMPELPESIANEMGRVRAEESVKSLREQNLDRLPGVPGVPDIMDQIPGPTYPELGYGLYDNTPIPGAYDLPSPTAMQGLPGGTPGAYDLPNLADIGPLPGGIPSAWDLPNPAAFAESPSFVSEHHLGANAPNEYDFSAPSLDDRIASSLSPNFGSYSAGANAPNEYDFSAPSLADRNANAFSQDRIRDFERQSFAGNMAPNFDQMNRDLMAELSPRQAPAPAQAFTTERYTEMTPEKYTVSREVPFSAPNAMQSAYAGVDEDKFGLPSLSAVSVNPQQKEVVATPAMRTISEERTRMVPTERTRQVPVQASVRPSLPSLGPPQEISAPPSVASASPSLSGKYGSLDNYLGSVAQGNYADLPQGYNQGWAQTAFGEGPYAVNAFDDLRNSVATDFGQPKTQGLYDSMPEWAQEGIKGSLMGGVLGGPMGMLTGGLGGAARSALGIPSLQDMLKSLVSNQYPSQQQPQGGSWGGSDGWGGYMDGSGILGGLNDYSIDGLSGTIGNNFGAGWGGDPSRDGGSRYSGGGAA
jgi:hypothetical protein